VGIRGVTRKPQDVRATITLLLAFGEAASILFMKPS
jgi:hypothetical protein